MELHGKNIIAGQAISFNRIGEGPPASFTARGELATFEGATTSHVQLAFEAAGKAFQEFRHTSADQRALFLERIGEEIEALGIDLLTATSTETALPIAERLAGERARTVGQLKMFAGLLREGSWVDARIDRANPERKPAPKPDLRRMLIPIGPVAVFSASNFPLAFSVAGGDTASALAAGCPVVVKAHPAHPATSELVARAIAKAAKDTGMPDGVISLLHSTRNEIAVAVVKHPLARAVAFTGSLRAGRVLFDAASGRPEPIPFYAEMGSINPVFILPGAMKERAEAMAQRMKASVTVGVGQLCTCPGVAVGIGDEHFEQFSRTLEAGIAESPPASMLYPGMLQSFEAGVKRISAIEGVRTVQSAAAAVPSNTGARPAVFAVGLDTFERHPELSEELFGPSTVLVRCDSLEEMRTMARRLEGQLTATIHGTPEDLAANAELVEILETRVGRLIFNGFPTGVEVCAAMQHGGPYPATTDSRSTSVGTGAILRFARPVAYQNFPQSSLPLELQDANPRGIWRLVDGQLTNQTL